MKWKLKALAVATMGAGLMAGGTGAWAQIVDGTPCDTDQTTNGLGQETCVQPDAKPAEGALFVAAEQVISLVTAVVDSTGCDATVSGSSVTINSRRRADLPHPSDTHAVAETTVRDSGAAGASPLQFLTSERVNSPEQPGSTMGARYYEVGLAAGPNGLTPGTALGATVSELSGTFTSDLKFAILIGNSDFRHGASELDEHIIKDFYQGIPVAPMFIDATALTPVSCTEAEYLAGTCILADPGDHSPSDPFEPVVVIRDNGLEVTTKKFIFDDLHNGPAPGGNVNAKLEVGSPKGKWRQTSFYRFPDGGGAGALRYTKVRIAPFHAAECIVRLSGTVSGDRSSQSFSGNVSVTPIF